MSTNHPKHPLIPPITILSYVAESDVVYSPDGNRVESCHRRIWQYFNTGDVFNARNKACRSAQKEIDRLAEHRDDPTDDHSPYRGIKLYFEYRINESGKKRKLATYRFYLLDGEGCSKTRLLERMEQESLFLFDAGNIFQRIEVTDSEGSVFMVASEGMD